MADIIQINQKMAELKQKLVEQKELTSTLQCALEIEQLWPEAQWPVFTSIWMIKGRYRFRLRDSHDKTKVISLKNTPKCLLERPHIQKVAEIDSIFKGILNRRMRNAG